MYARQSLEFGENKEGYWTADKFIQQIRRAVKIANIKYPKDDGWNADLMLPYLCHVPLIPSSITTYIHTLWFPTPPTYSLFPTRMWFTSKESSASAAWQLL